jgi:hypothetical protein
MSINKKVLFVFISIVVSIMIQGCGGGGGSSETKPSISGVAAAGAPIIGTVYIKDSEGTVKTQKISADGSYSVDVSGLVAPFKLKAEGSVAGRSVTYYSYAAEDDVDGNVNITPFTDLIIANAAQTIAENFFESNTVTELDSATLEREEQKLQEKLTNVLSGLGVESSIDLLRSSFSTDHSGLDAALDMLRFETDENGTVEIQNILTQETIRDSVVDNSLDETGTFTAVDTEDVSDLQKIYNAFERLESLFASGLPSESALGALVHDDFLDSDEDKETWVSEVSMETRLIGATFQINVDELNLEDGIAQVELIIYDKDNNLIGKDERLILHKDDSGDWLLYGNQRIVDIEAGFVCDKYEVENGDTHIGCGVWLAAEDYDVNNNNGQGELKSAKVYVERNGTVVSGTTVYLKTNDHGELFPYDEMFHNENSWDDYLGFEDTFVNFNANAIESGDKFVFEVYASELNTSLVDSGLSYNHLLINGDPVVTYKEDIIAAPHISATTSLLPNISQTTKNSFNTFTGGTLIIEVEIADGFTLDEVAYVADDGNERIENFSSSSLTIVANDVADMELDSGNFWQEIRVYSENEDGQTYMATYRADLIGDDTSNNSDIDAQSVFSGKKVSTKDAIDGAWEHWTFNENGTQFNVAGHEGGEGEELTPSTCYVSYNGDTMSVTSCTNSDEDEIHPTIKVNSYDEEKINVTFTAGESSFDGVFSILSEFTNEMISGQTVYEVYFDEGERSIARLTFNSDGSGDYEPIEGESVGGVVTNATWRIESDGSLITAGNFTYNEESVDFISKHVITSQQDTYIKTNCLESSDGTNYEDCGIDYYFYGEDALSNAQAFNE